jgi:hypothetical protein
MISTRLPRSGRTEAAGLCTSESSAQESDDRVDHITMNEGWRQDDGGFIHGLLPVNSAELVSKITVGQKEGQPFVRISISVFIKGFIEFHDFLLHPGERARRNLPVCFVDRLLRWIIELGMKPCTTHLGEGPANIYRCREVRGPCPSPPESPTIC